MLLVSATVLRRPAPAALVEALQEAEADAAAARGRLEASSLLTALHAAPDAPWLHEIHPQVAALALARVDQPDRDRLRLEGHRRAGAWYEAEAARSLWWADNIEGAFHLDAAGEGDRAFDLIGPLAEQLRMVGRTSESAAVLDLLHGPDRLESRRRAIFLRLRADIAVVRGDLAGALKAYETGRAIAERLAASDPGDAGWQRDLSVSWGKLGDVRADQGDLAGALQAYEETHKIISRLAGSDPGNAGWQRDLSVSWNKLGDVRVPQGDLAGALRAYEDARAIREKLAGSDPGNAGWQRDLSISWERVGQISEQQGDSAGALKAWRQALEHSFPLARAFSDSVDLVTAPVVHVAGIARDLPTGDQVRRAELATVSTELLALLQPLAAAGRLDAQRADWPDYLRQVLAYLRGEPPSGA